MNTALWHELETWAREEFRSVNGQIEFLLREAIRRRRGQAAEPAKEPAESAVEPKPEPPEAASSSESELEMGRHD